MLPFPGPDRIHGMINPPPPGLRVMLQGSLYLVVSAFAVGPLLSEIFVMVIEQCNLADTGEIPVDYIYV